MKVKDLQAKLAQMNPDAEVMFYQHDNDKFLSLGHAEAIKLKGDRKVCLLGEVDLKTKQWTRDALRAAGQGKEPNYDFLKDILGKAGEKK